MSDDTVISARNLTKAYRIWESPSSRLTTPMLETLATVLPQKIRGKICAHAGRQYRDFFALKDASFDVRRGEAFGIIGRNGSGKSTLLQILAGTLQPTSGTYHLKGRVAALLELGSGFNPEFTGRENVMLNGAILGFTRERMERLFPKIIDFADIGDFIEQPVKTYSSGMMVRLAFAVAVCVKPDLLIIDEALSVGDFFFAQKCFARIREILNEGASLLFVTHDTAAVVSLCRRAMWLERGECQQVGSAEDVARAYLASAGAGAPAVNAHGSSHVSQRSTLPWPADTPIDLSDCQHLGNQQVKISGVWSAAGPGREIHIDIGEWVDLTLAVYATRDLDDVSAGFEIHDRLGQVVHGNGLRATGNLIPRLTAGATILIRMKVQCLLAPGRYTIDVGCGNSAEHDNASDRIATALVLSVKRPTNGEIVHGLIKLPVSIEVGESVPAHLPTN